MDAIAGNPIHDDAEIEAWEVESASGLFASGVQTGGPALSPRFRMEANRIDREAALAISQNCCSRIFPAGPGGCLVGVGEWLSMPPSVVGLPSFRELMVHVTRPRTC